MGLPPRTKHLPCFDGCWWNFLLWLLRPSLIWLLNHTIPPFHRLMCYSSWLLLVLLFPFTGNAIYSISLCPDSLVPNSSITFMTSLLFQSTFLFWKLKDEIKSCLLLGRKAMTNLESILKNRDISLLTNVHIVKAMVFPIVMYGCESWTTNKAECRRMDAFELWCWRRLLRVSWTGRRSNHSILEEISPEYSLERLMLKLKLQYFGYLMWRTDSLEKTLMLGKIEGGGRRGRQRMRW